MLSYAIFVLFLLKKNKVSEMTLNHSLFCYFFPNFKVKYNNCEKFVECSKIQVRKLDFIFKEVKNISKYEKIFIICVVIKQAMIIITLIMIILSSPSGQILEENRSMLTGISL